jgi:hypothetical protein
MGAGGIARAIGALVGLWLLAVSPASAQERPKAVPQAGHPGGVGLAAWSHDSRYLVTIGSPFGTDAKKREVIIWDIAWATAIDRIDVPDALIPKDYRPEKDEQCRPGDNWDVERLTVDAADRVTLWGTYDDPCSYMASKSFMLAKRVWEPAVRVGMLPPDPEGKLPDAPNGKWLIADNEELHTIVVPGQGGRLFRPIADAEGTDSNAHFLWWPDGVRFATLDEHFVLRVYDIVSGKRERQIALPALFPRDRFGFDQRSLARIDFTPDAVTFWERRAIDDNRAVPVRIAADSFALSPPGAPRAIAVGSDLFKHDWPQSRSADRHYLHVAAGIARTAALNPPLQLSSEKGAMVSADVTSDATRVAFLRSGGSDGNLWLDVLDIDGLAMRRVAEVGPAADTVRWDQDKRLIVSKRITHSASDGPIPILLIDPAPGGRRWSYERRCIPAYFQGGMLAKGKCEQPGEPGDGWWIAKFGEEGWRPISFPALDGIIVEGIVGAAAAPRAAIIGCTPDARRGCGDKRLWLIDTASMRISGSIHMPDGDFGAVRLSPDGRRLMAEGEDGKPVAFALPAGIDGQIAAVPVPPDPAMIDILDKNGGWLPIVGAEWQRSDTNILLFARASDHKEIAQLLSLPDGSVTVFTPYGSYDTSRRPEYAGIDWLFADTPMKSLPVETFMRDYFEPNLLRRRLDCTLPATCTKVFHPAPDLSQLNRTLPHVNIADVGPGKLPGTADVTVIGRPTIDPQAPNGKTGSGLYNLRLYRDDRLVAQVGRLDPHLDAGDPAIWRPKTMLAEPGSTKAQTFHFTVALPPSFVKRAVTFRAYAFNEDRVKAETAVGGMETGPAAPRRPRLYLLTIGIDAYAGGGFPSLRYAGADARAMAQLLARLAPAKAGGLPYEVHAESVIGTAAEPATRARIQAAFARLRQARPDDTVIVTYAGHGFTDAKGRFSLVPSDARRIGDQPDPASLITAGDLSDWLEPVDAGEMAFIIDACHSAASVSAGGFKPGPMGDPGLGQLAYDKGIRILAASQPDEYAMELSSVGHGALTYALVQEGAAEGKADLDHDGFIRLDEMLRHAADAVQSAAAPLEDGEAPLVVNWGRDARYARQKPALFDYVGLPASAGLKALSPSGVCGRFDVRPGDEHSAAQVGRGGVRPR